MKILIIDGQGGNIGKQLTKLLVETFPADSIFAVGTNSIATSNMLKAGAVNVATGENSVKVMSRTADIIVGPLGIVIANALMGEVTPAMAEAVGSSRAKRVLIPMTRCDTVVAGVGDVPVGVLVEDAVAKIHALARV